MRHLLNTLFVLSEDIYLSLENENIIAWKEKKVAQKIPLLNLENILYFGYKGASPTLLGECAKKENRILLSQSKWEIFSTCMRSKLWECIFA